eukprot:gene27311-4615_t
MFNFCPICMSKVSFKFKWVELILRKHLLPPGQQHRLRFFDANGILDDQGAVKPIHGGADPCHHLRIPSTSDIVFVDLAVDDNLVATCNDPTDFETKDRSHRRTLDHLLRNLLELPNKPAVILVNSFKWAGLRSQHEEGGFSVGNCERDMFEFASYYQLPSVSMKTAVFHRMVAGEPGYKPFPPILHSKRDQSPKAYAADIQNYLYTDKHGNLNGVTGARVLGELAVQVVLDAAASLRYQLTLLLETKIGSGLADRTYGGPASCIWGSSFMVSGCLIKDGPMMKRP